MIEAMGAVAFVASPLQLLNATEARYALGFDGMPSLAVIGPTLGGERTSRQLQRTADLCGWSMQAVDSGGSYGGKHRGRAFVRRMRFFRDLRQLSLAIDPEALVLFGSLSADWQRHAAACSNTRLPPTLVADGIGEVEAVGSLRSRRGQIRRDVSVAKRLRASVLGEQAFRDGRLVWFTAYADSPDYSAAGIRRTANDWHWLRSRFRDKPVSTESMIVGQPLVEIGMVSRRGYTQAVAEVASRATAGSAIYIPHRREEISVVAEFAKEMGVSVALPDLPLELWLAAQPHVPAEVFGFSSSALIHVETLLSPRVRVARFVLEGQEVLPKYLAAENRVAPLFANYPRIEASSLALG